jgi:alpha-ketoglutarate-dependent taurine dioxygenase
MASLAISRSSAGLTGAELTSYEAGAGLPLFVQPLEPRLAHDGDCFRDWYWDRAGEIDGLLDEAGALVFRGFAVRNTQEFDRLVQPYQRPSFGYAGGATPRGKLGDRVFEATAAAPHIHIALHQEMCYLPAYPSRLVFFCRMPSVNGGETVIGDMRRVTDELDRHFIDAVDRLGIRYTSNFRDSSVSTGNTYLDGVHKTWQSAFSTQDPDQALGEARATGLEAERLDDGSIRTTFLGPGMIDHPRTGERLWFNQLQTLNLGHHNMARYEEFEHAYGATGRFPFAATLGDGTPVASKQAIALAETLKRCEVAFPWSSGDVLLIDNFRVGHGRNTFSGLRDVQVAMVA